MPHQVDIVEYVNTDRTNQYTLHTGSEAACNMNPGANFYGNTLGTQCRSGAGSNTGCGIRDFDGSAGAPFNAGGGGVFVLLWDATQLSFWRFARDEIPQDIYDGCPNPDGWGTPVAQWTNDSCDIKNAFRDMQRMYRPFRSLEHDTKSHILCSSHQWLSISPFVVTGLDLLITVATSQELARTPSQTHPTTTVRLSSPHDYHSLKHPSQTL